MGVSWGGDMLNYSMRLNCVLQKVMNSCLRARCIEIPADDERDVVK